MAAQKESTFLSMVLTLLIVSAVAATALAYVYQLTKEPIKKAKLDKKKTAIREVVPAFDNDPVSEMFKVGLKEGDSLECYPALMKGEFKGMAVRSDTKKGFSGEMLIMTGFLPDGTIYNTMVLEHKETPGLGDKTQKSKSLKITKKEDGSKDTTWWTKQFQGIKPKYAKEGDFEHPSNIKVKKDGGEIHAITAATISSRAYSDAINRGYHAFTLAMKKFEELKVKS